MRKVSKGLRYVWPDPEYVMAGASALSYRRYQLGARPLAALFHEICRPLATAETPGAFLFGLRLMAIDGTAEDVADTPANVAAFGWHHGDRGDSAFPQVKGVYLVECGTHAVTDAGFWPCHVSERHGGFRLLRAVGPGMLLMWDRGFHNFDRVAQAHATGAEILARVPSQLILKPVQTFADGTFTAYLTPIRLPTPQRWPAPLGARPPIHHSGSSLAGLWGKASFDYHPPGSEMLSSPRPGLCLP